MLLYLSGIILAFFLSFVLLTKRNKTNADYLLVAWLGITGFHLLSFYLFSNGLYTRYPTPVVIGFTLPLVQGPFLYLYTYQQTSFPARFNKKKLLHFLPVILSFLLFMKFHFLSPDEKTAVFLHSGKGYETQMDINLYAIYLSGITYITLSIKQLIKYKKTIVQRFSNTEKINFNWLLYMIIWMAVIWVTVLFINDERWVFAFASMFILWLGYFSIKQVQVYSTGPATIMADQPTDNEGNDDIKNQDLTDNVSTLKYQKSTLTNEDASAIHQQLKQLIAEEKPYTNPDLTLDELARLLEVHPNNLSQVINSREQMSFYDLINKRRVEEFMQLLSSSFTQQYTLLGIAYDCGFNSKASFNRNFKKYTGQTPSEYLKQQATLQP